MSRYCENCGARLPHIDDASCAFVLSNRYQELIDKQVKPEDKERIKRLAEKHRHILEDPRMADDYNPETGKRDGIPYWERPEEVSE